MASIKSLNTIWRIQKVVTVIDGVHSSHKFHYQQYEYDLFTCFLVRVLPVLSLMYLAINSLRPAAKEKKKGWDYYNKQMREFLFCADASCQTLGGTGVKPDDCFLSAEQQYAFQRGSFHPGLRSKTQTSSDYNYGIISQLHLSVFSFPC